MKPLQTLSGRKPSQHPEELAGFIALLQQQGVKRYAEIGARHGDTFYEVMTSLPKGSVGIAVDLPGGAWGNGSTAQHLDRACAELRAKGYTIHRIFGDSTDPDMVDRVLSLGFVDAVLIDGDHRYAGVKQDWENYRNLVDGGLVAFHDIVGTGQFDKPRGFEVEVPILWSEIKAMGFQTREFIGESSTMGIGVVWPWM